MKIFLKEYTLALHLVEIDADPEIPDPAKRKMMLIYLIPDP
jgi:hypothetical protein